MTPSTPADRALSVHMDDEVTWEEFFRTDPDTEDAVGAESDCMRNLSILADVYTRVFRGILHYTRSAIVWFLRCICL